MCYVKLKYLTKAPRYDSITIDNHMEALMLTQREIDAINEWLAKGFEIEIYKKPDGTLNIKTVRKKRLNVE